MKKITFKMTVLSLSLIALSLNVMGQKAPSISDTNLILNGSFEEGTWEYVNGTTTITGSPNNWQTMSAAWAIENPVTHVYLLDKTASRSASITAMSNASVAWCASLPETTDLLTPPDGNVIAVINNAFLMQNVTLPAGTYTFSGNYMRYVYTTGSGSGIYIFYLDASNNKVYTTADVNLIAGETTLNLNGSGATGTTQFNHWDSFSKQFTLTAPTTVTVQIDLPGAHPGPWVGGSFAIDNLKLVSTATTALSTPKVNNGLVISEGNNELIINSPKELSTAIYSIVGSKIKELQLQAGYNTVSGLQKGIYIVDGQKVVIR